MSALIELRGARKIYEMGQHKVHALDGVDLEIHRGEFAAIVGPSGSGKSTLMHMLGCLDRLTTGRYLLAGQDMSTAHDAQLSEIRNRRIGFVFQQFNLLPHLTVLENIALPLAYSGLKRPERLRRARVMAEKVGLGERIDHKPNELSGGQCQRVAIARALIQEPEVLFADEPTGALDSKTGKEILALLDELNEQGHTILLVTHDPKIADHAHRKITLSDGKIVSDQRRDGKAEPAPTQPKPLEEQGYLGFRDMLRMGLREGLLAHKLRTALTMLGVIIGVASVIAMSSFSEGSKLKQANQIRALGANLIRIVDRRLEGPLLHQARARGSQGLTRKDERVLRDSLSDIQTSALARDMDLEVLLGRSALPQVRVRGVAGDYLAVNNLRLQAGADFHPSDDRRQSRVAIIGAGLVPSDRTGQEVIGEPILIAGQPYEIIGVLENKFLDTTELEAVGANDSNFDVLAPLGAFMNRLSHQPLRSELDEILLQLRDEDRLSEAGRSIRRILDVRHQGVEDYDLIIPLDLLKSKQESQKLLDILSLSISAISLVVGGIGIMNIMLAAVTERLKEIGIRRAVGARRVDIRRQFLVEAITISMVGGLAGVLLAGVGVAIASRPLDFPIVFNTVIVFIAFGASFTTGLLFGAYPAIQAANQNLVEILSRD